VFSEPGVWSEEITTSEVHRTIAEQLVGDAALRLCTEGDQVAGFCWAQLLDAEEIVEDTLEIEYFQEYGKTDLLQAIRDRVGEREVVYVHEIGVVREYRGTMELGHLIVPVLESVATAGGTRDLAFWTLQNTMIGSLAGSVGHRACWTDGTIELYCFEFPDLSPWAP